MKKRISQTTDDGETGIDLTPMLDIVFILLIFFVVTTSFVNPSVQDLQLPASQLSPTSATPTSITVSVDSSGQAWYEHRAISLDMLRVELARAKQGDSQRPLLILADTRVPAGHIVTVMDQARMAGLSQIALGTKPQ